MGFPGWYQLPAAKKTAVHLLGNAVVPAVAAGVLKQVRSLAFTG
jgi:site-specific DNA-cytosine methylase